MTLPRRTIRWRFYQSRPYLAWTNRCWACLRRPFHGDEDRL